MNYQKRKDVIKNLLVNIKWFVLPAISVLYVSTAILMLVGIIKLVQIFNLLYCEFNNHTGLDFNLVIAHFISIIDIYLLALVLYIFAVAIYKLFIGEYKSLGWLKIESVDDLKSNIAKMTILFLSTLLVQKITEWKDPQGTLYFGGIIIGLSIMLIVFIHLLKNNNSIDNNKNHEKLSENN